MTSITVIASRRCFSGVRSNLSLSAPMSLGTVHAQRLVLLGSLSKAAQSIVQYPPLSEPQVKQIP